jgi:hypothetical protein
MKLFTFAFVLAAFATGCASAMTEPTKDASQWERRKIAEGVEIVVSPEAGPEAQRVVDMIQSEMRARYIGAR